MRTSDLISQSGLKLDAPNDGDVVTVLVRYEKNSQHYRHENIWRVLSVNGSHALIECLTENRKPELWLISAHEWFEAGALYGALQEAEQSSAAEVE